MKKNLEVREVSEGFGYVCECCGGEFTHRNQMHDSHTCIVCTGIDDGESEMGEDPIEWY